MNKSSQILILLCLIGITSASAQTDSTLSVDNNEIKALRKLNKNKSTYNYRRKQQLTIFSPFWENSKESKKEIVKKVFPKLYDFFEANNTFEANLILDGIKKRTRIKESLISSSATGLKRPKLISLILQNQYTDLEFNILHITGGRFYNPLYFPNKYNFTKTENKGDNQAVNIYKFSPKRKSKYTLEGYFHSNKAGSIDYFYAYPITTKEKLRSFLLFENQIINGVNYPKFTQSEIHYTSSSNKIGEIKITSKNKISNITTSTKQLRTSNIILDFDNDSTYQDSTNKEFNYTLDYLENLRLGRLGIGKIDVLLKHLINYNTVEGVRLGIGIGTNEKLSKNFDVGGYNAIGLLDQLYKFGGFGNIYFHRKTNTTLSISYANDLSEPGGNYFPFSKRIFYNEGFRKYGLSLMDKTERLDAKLKTTLLTNISVENRFTLRNHTPLYDYSFGSDSLSSFTNSEISFGIRYNPDEKFFKMNNDLYSLGSKYPSLFINYSKSIDLNNGLFFNYERWDFKIEKHMNLMQYGIVDFQLIGGLISNQNIPYPFLYNMKGSFKPGTPIINNTFGTMLYNEFMGSKYGALFYNHNIGKITHQETFAPELILIHNMGITDAINSNNHNNIGIMSMQHGYFESGFYFKNLLSFQHIIGQTGFGMGFLYRYGYYAHAKEIDNLVFKFSLDFDI